eukprot:TRINITY_DN6041_c0_g1_i1.p1 TRINITY_DN6041_c0_g1~~TRINITY_DN6041_c0_g1_i1.p1  ORF type:complete len:242 (-),score=43.61 TRINITY_DN6041_c0_g1_i1:173-898(-)
MSWLWGEQQAEGPAVVEWKYDDLPTPTSDDEFRALAVACKQRIEPWIRGPEGWTMVDEDQATGVKLWEREVVGTEFHALKCSGIINYASVEDVVHLFWSASLEERQKLAPELLEGGVLRTIDEGRLKLSFARFQTPFVIANREFVSYRARENLDDGSIFLYGESVNCKERPFSPDAVRSVVLNAVLLEPIEDGGEPAVRMTSVDMVDPRGWVPAAIVNLFKKKPMERMGRIQSNFRAPSSK